MGLKGPDVYGPAEVQRILGGVTRQRLHQIRRQYRGPGAPPPGPFPTPTPLEIGNVWDGPLIRAWQQARTRPRRRAMYVLATQYGRHGNVSKAARSAGIHRTTAVSWLRELGMKLPGEKLDVNREETP
jgi:hypothetical protein